MRKKSKFITFILSFLPGLSHFYLGFLNRGIVYLALFGGLGLGTFGLAAISRSPSVLYFFLFGAPVIWLVALVDAFAMLENLRYKMNTNIGEEKVDPMETEVMNRKVITLALSIIPGAGHMYLGYQQKGLLLMGAFFFSIFFMGWLNLSFLVFILPLIWFYSFFNAFHTLNGNHEEDMDFSKIIPSMKPEYVGKGLIVVGILILLQKVFYPVIDDIIYAIYGSHILYEFKVYMQTTIVSVIFIIGGIKILQKNKIVEIEEVVVEGEVVDEE